MRRSLFTMASLFGAATIALTACTGADREPPRSTAGSSAPAPGTPPAPVPAPAPAPAPTPAPTPAPAGTSAPVLSAYTPAEALAYLGRLAPSVVSRVLTAAERAQIQSSGGAAIEPIVTAWTREPGFVVATREFLEQSLSVSGTRNGVDFSLPGNLATQLVRNNRPWSEILTSTTCYGSAGNAIACDTGAPYAAGVLTTRAYMVSRNSRFNLTRAGTMLKNFACTAYPMADTVEPRVDRAKLIPMFRANTPAEQTDERARSGFGNGTGCYACHGQFAPHSQLFVKFDSAGQYVGGATGLQDPAGELGRSVNGLMASHYVAPGDAGSEASQMFGQPVTNLAAAGRVMAQQNSFVECTARRLLDHSLGVAYGAIEYKPGLFSAVAARTGAADPSFSQIATALYTDRVVVRSIVTSLTGQTP